MRIHRLHPTVTEESILWHPHPFCELEHLPGCLIIILGITRQFTHIGYRRDAHEHIVEPECVLLRTDTGESAVREAVFLVHDIIGIVVDQWAQGLFPVSEERLDHRTADSPGIVEGMRVDDAADIPVNVLILRIDLLEIRSDVSQQLMTLDDIVTIGVISSSSIGSENTRVSDTPLITCQSESALLQLSRIGNLLVVRHRSARILIHQRCRSLGVDILKHPVHDLLHLLRLRHTIADAICWFHQMQRCIIVVHLLGKQRCGHKKAYQRKKHFSHVHGLFCVRLQETVHLVCYLAHALHRGVA